MAGLQKLCKAYGRIKCGNVLMARDYVNDVALPESELRADKARWTASERRRFGLPPGVGSSSAPIPSIDNPFSSVPAAENTNLTARTDSQVF